MLSNIKIGSYYNTKSLVHELNAFSKLLVLILFSIILSFVNNYIALLFVLALLIIYLILTKIPILYYLKTINYIKWFIIFILILNILTTFSLYKPILDSLKLIMLLLLSMSYIYTTQVNDILKSLYLLLSPLKNLKIDIKKPVIILSFAIKFIPNVINSYNEAYESMKVRGISFSKVKILNKFEIIKLIIVYVFKKMLKQANDVSRTLEIRNYSIDFEHNLELDINDLLLIDITLIILLGVIICAI